MQTLTPQFKAEQKIAKRKQEGARQPATTHFKIKKAERNEIRINCVGKAKRTGHFEIEGTERVKCRRSCLRGNKEKAKEKSAGVLQYWIFNEY
jgi:hypothetical protein